MGEYKTDYFIKMLNELGISLNEIQINQFVDYYKILVEWNKVMNLTNIIEFEDVIIKHFIDSLTLVKAIDIDYHQSIIDIGTGAGFPGIPLKIAFPHLDIVLLDSLKKRINFLNEVIKVLKLEDIKAIHGRAEEYASEDKYREKFDLCVSRAVANLASLSEYCIPYVKLGGSFISYKSGKIEEELTSSKKAIKQLGGIIKDEVLFKISDTDISRNLVVIEKIRNTPKKYPRKAGTPTKDPIV